MLGNYYEKAITFAIFPTDRSCDYLCLGGIGEIGELAEKVKKIIRDTDLDYEHPESWPEEKKKLIMLELGDVMWYFVVKYYMDALYGFGSNVKAREKFMLEVDQKKRFISNKASKENVTIGQAIIFLSAVANALINGIDVFGCKYEEFDDYDRMQCLAMLFGVVWYIANLLGYELKDVCDMNLDKLSSRMQRDKIHGSGDER